MPVPDFLKFACANADSPQCVVCPREFVVAMYSIEGAFKAHDGTTLVSILGSHYCPDPHCKTWLRFVKTSMLWDDFVSLLDGKLQDAGTCTMQYKA